MTARGKQPSKVVLLATADRLCELAKRVEAATWPTDNFSGDLASSLRREASILASTALEFGEVIEDLNAQLTEKRRLFDEMRAGLSALEEGLRNLGRAP